MAQTKHIPYLASILAVSALTLCTAPSWAARDFTPQAGTWVISDEVDGKPGRGFAIDVQGNTFYMQVFGYEKNGDATFYAAMGQMEGDTVTAPLIRYQGGRSFGSEPRDAQEDKSIGDVKLSFRNGLQGTIQLPGESAKDIERFIFTAPDAAYYQTEQWKNATRSSRWLGLNAQGEVVNAWYASLQSSSTEPLRLHLYRESHAETLECSRPVQSDIFRCVAAGDISPGQAPEVKEVKFRLLGAQVAGTVSLQAEGAAPLLLLGFNTRVDFPYRGAVITGCCSNGLESYLPGTFGYSHRPAYLPSNGTWVMVDELTGKPGRGVSLDVQGGKMLMQVFGYLPNGQPNFSMGVGDYAADPQEAGTSGARFNLQQYRGGRSVGGAAASGQWLRDDGEVEVRISGAKGVGLAEAVVQFPGEPAKPMRRISLQPWQTTEDKLFGEWYIPGSFRDGVPVTITLNRLDGDFATTEDGSVRCKFNAQVSRGQCQRSGATENAYAMDLYDEFVVSNFSIRLRDRHGNLTGLGNVPMD
ncbi:hypothetical protein [Comamonas koreensis]|uniref:Uncharacterized protein n=1 Tax=Comamonas koreensis TaxID=160825 RepID=A0AAW4XRI1_9BURK|nr:hypothetical protein [Comamonas koreensis]MCD2164168.1 hypothetical protein [Comamonas koreensis]